MDFQELIRIRRSIRAYRPTEVPEDVLHRVLDAGRVAPTACNIQPFQLVVVTDPEVRAKLKAAYRHDWFWKAPTIVAGCVEPAKAWVRGDGFNSAEVDIAIVMDHIILAATEEGLGTCWVCAFDEPRAKEILGVPEGVRIVAMTPLGYPAAEPAPCVRKPLRELVRKNRW
ncbi:MAG: nitroreductase family protein [Polyangia bacterium]|jgi:nitroreductase